VEQLRELDRQESETVEDSLHESKANVQEEQQESQQLPVETRSLPGTAKKRFVLERLNIVRELVGLQAAHEGFIASGRLHGFWTSFDPQLVNRLKAEPWYKDARNIAFDIMQLDSDTAVNRAVAVSQQLRGKLRRNEQATHVTTERELQKLTDQHPTLCDAMTSHPLAPSSQTRYHIA
jgi:hypothetical protein